MNGELTNDSEELIKILGDRIEEIERTLSADEDFCNQEINGTYQAALKYLKSFERKFTEKLNELKDKLDQIRKANTHASEQNRAQFDKEIEEINQSFSSGKHQEVLDKFHQYEKRFEQRTTMIEKVPKLYMQEIDINRYFSIDKPLVSPAVPLTTNKSNTMESKKQTKTDIRTNEIDDQELTKPSSDVRFKHSTSEYIVKRNSLPNKEPQTPLPSISSHSLCSGTRLSTSSSAKNPARTEHNIKVSPLSKPSNNQNPRENISSYTQVRSTPSSSNIIPPLMQIPTATLKTSKGDGLASKYVAPYQHERDTCATMACNSHSLILFRSQAGRSDRWCSILIDRSNPTQRDSKWHNLFIKSVGFTDQRNVYIFTEREFHSFSHDLSTKHYSVILLNESNYNTNYRNVHLGCGGTVHDKYIYHLYLNTDSHWILSVLEFESSQHVCDHDLTTSFLDVNRFINIYINDRTISFLVQMNSAQYAVIFSSNNIHSKMELKRLIQLSYAADPLSICSVDIPYIKKEIYFVNDPSAKVIHIFTNEKYLQSYALTAHTLCYVRENQELIYVSNDGIYSININEQQNFFSKFH